MVCDFFGFEPRHQRLSLLGLRVLGLIHLGGCIVWLVKVLTTSEASVDSFLNDFADHEGEFVDLSTLSGKLSAYCVCTYFVTTIFSTVGFGDISATNLAKRVVYSVLMLYGILVFGNLLAELAEFNRTARMLELSKMENVQGALDFMHGHHVPRWLINEVLRYTRFLHEHGERRREKERVSRQPSNESPSRTRHRHLRGCAQENTPIHTFA